MTTVEALAVWGLALISGVILALAGLFRVARWCAVAVILRSAPKRTTLERTVRCCVCHRNVVPTLWDTVYLVQSARTKVVRLPAVRIFVCPKCGRCSTGEVG